MVLQKKYIQIIINYFDDLSNLGIQYVVFIKTLLYIGLIFSAINPAFASPEVYIKADVGYSKAHSYKDYTSGIQENIHMAKPHISPSLGAELGYIVNDNIKLGISIHTFATKFNKNYEEINYKAEKAMVNESVNLNTRQFAYAKLKIKTKVVMLNGYYNFTNFKNFTPYLTLGLGFAHHKSSDYLTGIPSDDNFVAKIPGGSKNSFSWNIGAGTQVPINDNLSFDFTIRYFDCGKTATRNELYVNNVRNTPKGQVGTTFKTTMATFGIVYKF